MESVDVVGLRDATRSFGKKATADHRIACLFCNVFITFERFSNFVVHTLRDACWRVLKCVKTQQKELKAMLYCMREEKYALAEAVPKDRKALSTRDTRLLGTRSFRCIGKPNLIGRGNYLLRMNPFGRIPTLASQPKTENLNHDRSTSFSILRKSNAFSLGQGSDSPFSNRMEVAFLPNQSANSSLVVELKRSH